MKRSDGRAADELRPVTITRKYLKFAHGSVLIEMGDTKVICTAIAEERVPPFLRGSGKGWVTAEYSMLPGSSDNRIARRTGGRTHEIQRLIGRSLRAVIDLEKIGERTITIDCDVIQADGGTRTASITGAFVALSDTISGLIDSGALDTSPLTDSVAAVSVGKIDGYNFLDLPYEEDSVAEVDMNVVMTGSGKFIEVQGTAETGTFSKDEMDGLVGIASKGIKELTTFQKNSLAK